VARVVARLALQSGEPLQAGETIVERRLYRGARVTAVAPPLASGWSLSIRKPVRTESSLEEMVRVGAMSRAMSVLLEACLSGRANVLVVGSGPGAITPVLAALAFASAAGERIAVVTESDEIQVAHAFVTRITAGPHGVPADQALRTASRLRPDRLVVSSLAGPLAAATIDAVSEGTDGVIAGVAAPTLRHALSRLAAQVGLARAGASIEAAREAVAESFEIAVEVVRSIEGRTRVARLAELGGADATGIAVRDLFVSSADGTGEAGFAPTGATPRFAQDFAARGIRLDPGLFKRR
jgi:pilus assembly protein CpaF